MTTTMAATVAGRENEYRYERFTLPLMLRDLWFGGGSLQPGETVPDVVLADLGGSTHRLNDLLSAGPTVLVTGSLTCPMTSSSAPLINDLHAEFGKDVQFLLLYVREAHPGKLTPQPALLQEKVAHAEKLKSSLNVEPRVVVDDVDGTLHKVLDAKPNAAFIFDASGRLLYRSIWASDVAGLRRALSAVGDGRPLARRESKRILVPMVRAIGYVAETMTRGGRSAHRDLLLAMAPMEAAGLLAAAFRPLPARLRGLAAIGSMVAFFATAAIGVALLI